MLSYKADLVARRAPAGVNAAVAAVNGSVTLLGHLGPRRDGLIEIEPGFAENGSQAGNVYRLTPWA